MLSHTEPRGMFGNAQNAFQLHTSDPGDQGPCLSSALRKEDPCSYEAVTWAGLQQPPESPREWERRARTETRVTQPRLWECTPLSRRESAEGTAGTQLHHDTCLCPDARKGGRNAGGAGFQGPGAGEQAALLGKGQGGAGGLQEHQAGALGGDGADAGGKGWQEGGLKHGTSAARGKGASPTRLTTNKCYWVKTIRAFNNTSPSEGKRRARLLNSNWPPKCRNLKVC